MAAMRTDLLSGPGSVWAGYKLWEITVLEPVVEAWATATATIGDSLTTSISVLHTPPGPPFPPVLQGVPIVHLAFASVAGQHSAVPLLRALRRGQCLIVEMAPVVPALKPQLQIVHADGKQCQRHRYHDGEEGTHSRPISRAMRESSR